MVVWEWSRCSPYFLVEWLWFSAIGYFPVFWTTIRAEAKVFFAANSRRNARQ
jgi:uncharacterized membrane protein (UPF0182 family)